MENDLYNRQESLGLRNIPIAVVIGCGGTGAWTAIFLAMSGVNHLRLVDPDTIELSNLNRLPYSRNDIGRHKVTPLVRMIHNIRPEVILEAYTDAINNTNIADILFGANVVYCCTDNVASQRFVQSFCKSKGIDYQRIGYDGTYLNVGRSFPLSFDEEKEQQVGYTYTPSWVVPAVFASSAGVYSTMKSRIELLDDMSTVTCAGDSIIPRAMKEKLIGKGIEKVQDDPYEYLGGSWGNCDNCSQCSECNDRCPGSDVCDSVTDAYEEGIDEGKRRLRGDIEDDPWCMPSNAITTIRDSVLDKILMWIQSGKESGISFPFDNEDLEEVLTNLLENQKEEEVENA